MDDKEQEEMFGFTGFGKRKKQQPKQAAPISFDSDVRKSGPSIPVPVPVSNPDAHVHGGAQHTSQHKGFVPSGTTQDHQQQQQLIDEEIDEEDEEDEAQPLFPTSHEAILKEHKKVVSALAIDPSGARFSSGSHDYDVKLWDFGGMGGGVGRPFKSFEPNENYYVSRYLDRVPPHRHYFFLPLFSVSQIITITRLVLASHWPTFLFLCLCTCQRARQKGHPVPSRSLVHTSRKRRNTSLLLPSFVLPAIPAFFFHLVSRNRTSYDITDIRFVS
ncbi:hypothetical protein FRC20_000672 [Serendipita sp. 405]|nr:hypothetical protein FRC20_000672 [Serendipita sp. 405]